MLKEPRGWETAYRKRPSGEYEPHQDSLKLNGLFQEHNVNRILDLGCGDGRHLVYFAKHGYSIYGVDSAPTALCLAKKWLSKEKLSAELVYSDMSAIPFTDGFFDAVICVQVINHYRLEGIRYTIREIKRILASRGWVFVTVSTSRPCRADMIASGKWVELEQNTYMKSYGHEKGVPHYFFDMEGLINEFSSFEIIDLHEDKRDYTCMLARARLS